MAAIAAFSMLLFLSAHGAAPALGLTRSDFPQDFVFGAATSAYQYEGAVSEDGRSPSIWDTFTHAGKMVDKSTGDVAADGDHKYKDDVKLMADTNVEAYRFSISWSRLIPNGRGAVNPKGLEYYNDLIDELMKRGIQVHVMLYHLDFPQVLDDEYGGWLSPRIVEDFTAFADVCFREFGDRVSHWTTIDEPNVGTIGSYDNGLFAPGRCSDSFGPTEEPYIAHNMLLAHASATRLCREKYQIYVSIKGVLHVGHARGSCWPTCLLFLELSFYELYYGLRSNQKISGLVFGWILEPLVFGDYPQVMRKIVGSRLPSFTKFQSVAIKSAIDFIGINHYYSLYVSADRPLDKGARDNAADMSVYQRGNASSNDTLDDTDRVEYLKSYIGSTLTALRNGAKVKGYFVWSFMDVFEFLLGYQSHYGLYRVDFNDEARPRQARISARWYSSFLKNNGIHVQNELDNAGSHAQQ